MMELLPCPFCSGKADFERRGTPRVSTIVRCGECGCCVESGDEFDHEASWNMRTPAKPPKENDYWKGYMDAIRQADIHLQCTGDDRTIRHCRQIVLALCGIEYEPNEAVPIPAWPPEEYVLAYLPNMVKQQ